jgi:asparagine synthetase B (glutamine-hydrolysing)
LLSITGTFCPQPFVSERYTVLFNGEIYNSFQFGEFDSDGKCLVPSIDMHGDLFARQLDGEFAIALVDHYERKIIFSGDTFGTKPLYFARSEGFVGLASYPSTLTALGFRSVFRVPPNTIFSYSYDEGTLAELGSITEFSLTQYKSSFRDWIDAFEFAVRKRASGVREKLFIGLSSGYDSGAICAALVKLGIKFHSYSLCDHEDMEILQLRTNLMLPLNSFDLIYLSEEERNQAVSHNNSTIERLNYGIYTSRSNYNEFHKVLHDDTGALGLSVICSRAAKQGRRIYLSGQGADEIVSDYGFAGQSIYPHSNFGGLFPNDLHTIFPWPSFYGSSQASYLMKEEHVAGSYGIEARYPFLDKRVVQEFISLDVNLKNNKYKSAIREYLETTFFPYREDEKRGFLV